MRHTAVLVLGCLLLAVVVAACGGGASDADIEATVEARVEVAKTSAVAQSPPTQVPTLSSPPVATPTPRQVSTVSGRGSPPTATPTQVPPTATPIPAFIPKSGPILLASCAGPCPGEAGPLEKILPRIGKDADWYAVAVGPYHTVAIKLDGTLWAWGSNFLGQLGIGTITEYPEKCCYDDKGVLIPQQVGVDNNWSVIDIHGNSTVALKSDGTLWTWGDNESGQLGDGTTTDKVTPHQVGSDITWTSVSNGAQFMIGIKSDGTLWTWGDNESGQLGDGTTTKKLTPHQVGSDTNWSTANAHEGKKALALKSDGTMWGWGGGDFFCKSIISCPSDSTKQLEPLQIGTDTDWSSVSYRGNHAVALKSNGTLWTWGNNDGGQLGLGHPVRGKANIIESPTEVGGTDWTAIATGWLYTFAIKSDGSLWGWGCLGGWGERCPDVVEPEELYAGEKHIHLAIDTQGNKRAVIRLGSELPPDIPPTPGPLKDFEIPRPKPIQEQKTGRFDRYLGSGCDGLESLIPKLNLPGTAMLSYYQAVALSIDSSCNNIIRKLNQSPYYKE